MNTTTNVWVASSKFIYVQITDREDLEKIDRPLIDVESRHGKVLVKELQQDDVRVIFQYWLQQPATI